MEFLGAIVFVFIIVAVLINGNVFTSLSGYRKPDWAEYEREFRRVMAPSFKRQELTDEEIEESVDQYIKGKKADWDYYVHRKKRPLF